MKRRILIVTGSFAPTMIADMHRARHLAWELPKLGFEVEILAPDTSYQPPSCVDNDSAEFFPASAKTHYVAKSGCLLSSILGLRSIGWRALIPMLRVGGDLLRQQHFDLVYISTAQFPLFLVGPIWKRKFGVRFILDIHDPVYQEAANHPIWSTRSVRHTVSYSLTKYIETRTTAAAAGLVSVSPNYIETLRRRYSGKRPDWLRVRRHVAIPFAVLPHDIEEAARRIVPAHAKSAWVRKIVYVGAGGPIMARAFSLLCRALSQLREEQPNLVERIRVEVYGTMLGWRKDDACHLAAIADQNGVADLVREDPTRISYRRSLEVLLESDGALILGVDDAGYMPSKLYSYALSGKPLLASLRRDSPAFSQFQTNPELGHCLWFSMTGEMATFEATSLLRRFLLEVIDRREFDRRAILEPVLAETMAQRHVELFERCMPTCW